MKKRFFLKSLSVILSGMAFGVRRIPGIQELPKYWVWLRPDLKNTDADWHQVFAKLSEAGIQAVLPQIYSSHEALFANDDSPVKERWLERIIPIAHKHGIEIHAWMWTMPCNDPKMLADHPDWYVVNRDGKSAATHPAYVPYYKFLCPRRPEVRSFVQRRVKALASIPDLDGIHLDYVRMPDVILAEGLQPKYDIVQDREYPEYDYCYCTYCREAYESVSGVDPVNIQDPANDKEWYQFRYDAVNDLVNNFLVPEARREGKTITAAVFPNWESVRQQWHKWDLDGFLPMLYQGFYNEEVSWIADEVKAAKERMADAKPVFAGLFIPHLQDTEVNLVHQMNVENGDADGFALFAYGNLKEKDFAAIRRVTRR